jgi:hypothetical protein
MKTLIFTALTLLALPAAARADDFLPDPELALTMEVPALPFLDDVKAETVLGDESGDDTLAIARGREDTSASATLDGLVSGNSASNMSTGANTIMGGSFANMSGLPVVIQNSGANVLIQNATVINLQLR